MTNSYTTTETFTRTNARYLAAKVAADLNQMQEFYGKPSDSSIGEFIEELVVLLLEDCLDSVTYGYKRNGDWILALNYRANSGVIESTDSRAGGVQAGINVAGANWYSYLKYNSKYHALSSSEKERIHNAIPIQRSGADEPAYSTSGTWVNDNKSYYSGGASLNRKIFIPN